MPFPLRAKQGLNTLRLRVVANVNTNTPPSPTVPDAAKMSAPLHTFSVTPLAQFSNKNSQIRRPQV